MCQHGIVIADCASPPPPGERTIDVFEFLRRGMQYELRCVAEIELTVDDRQLLQYGVGDASYRAAGERAGIATLIDAFYRIMDEHPGAQNIRRMHPGKLDESRDKLTRFLCGWLNGPPLFSEKYGSIKLPKAHAHLRIGPDERDAWLFCMERAISEQDYAPEFGAYLLRELSAPAQRILATSRDPITG